MSEQNNTVSTHTVSCQNCGATLTYKPEDGKLICEYCDTEQDIEVGEGIIEEKSFDHAIAHGFSNKDAWGEVEVTVSCKNCGATVLFDKEHVTSSCSFCDSSQIIVTDGVDAICPESIIPFKVDREKSKGLFDQWLKKRWYVPNKLKKNCSVENLKGIYIPYWTYDAQTLSNYSARVGDYYYVNETVYVEKDGKRVPETRRVRKTRYRNESGQYSMFYNDVLVKASNNYHEGLMQKIEPFHLEELVPYKPEYLLGFVAEKYSVDLEAGWKLARQDVKDRIERDIRHQLSGDVIDRVNVKSYYSDRTYKHLLLPIWISAYTYRDKVYNFIINGQTGEVQGQSPISVLKVLITLGCIGLIGAFIYIMINLGAQ